MKYRITKVWYDEEEIIESDRPLSYSEIRNSIDENRLDCDEVQVEEMEDDEDE